MAFLQNLEKLCFENGESLYSVAAVIGKSTSTVTGWRQGSVPRNSTLKAIADHFGVTVDYLLSDDKNTPDAWDSRAESSEFLPLSSAEKQILEMYRATTDRGRVRMIQRILNVFDEEQNK